MDALIYMRKHSAPWDEWTCAFAAMGGQKNARRWVLEMPP